MKLGTPLSDTAVRVMLLGSGELGKEVAIELQRLGVEVIAVDRYPNAPAMQVAHRSHVIPMTDPQVLNGVILAEAPHFIVPEIEAIATEVLADIEAAGLAVVIPAARAVQLTMNREGIRRLAAEELGLPASPYAFAGSAEELAAGAETVGYPCFVKPVMSSSGKGQSFVESADEIADAWTYAQDSGRVAGARVIVEGRIDFDFEITLLTVRSRAADGSTRREPAASAVIYGGMEAQGIAFEGVAEALSVPTADLRLFGKPEAFDRRRMGVATARGGDVDEARERAREAAGRVKVVRA
jgi:phosphoribosylglycinamide formyltransferase 2